MTPPVGVERRQPLPQHGAADGGAASDVGERRRIGREMQAALPPGSGPPPRLARWLRRNADAGQAAADALDLAGPVAGAAVVAGATGWRIRRRRRRG